MNDATNRPAWQKGEPLERLRQIAAVFQEHEQGLVYGQFAGTSERAVAEWLAAHELFGQRGIAGQHPWGGAMVVLRIPKAAVWVQDFRGVQVARIPAGALHVKRFAAPRGEEHRLVEALRHLTDGRDFWLESWAEHPVDRRILAELGAEWIGTKIAASSEIRQVSYVPSPADPGTPRMPYTRVDRLCLAPLPPGAQPSVAGFPVLAASVQERVGALWEQHYSSYNKGKAWTAVALRGFGGGVAQIEKPAEMSKAWKAENPGRLGDVCRDTELLAELPELRAFLHHFPAEFERVRLMRLAPGGGELTRHADITNREAGTEIGQLVRLHFPLITNPGVRFQSWGLEGERHEAHMEAGRWWYLDQRKPHTAKNAGAEARIHLVADAWVNDWLRLQLSQAQEADA